MVIGSLLSQVIGVDNYVDYLAAYNNDRGTNFTTIQEVMGNDYASGLGFDAFLEAMGVNSEGISNIDNADRFCNMQRIIKKRAQAVKDNWRYRKANDYKNTDAIIKWQDDHWLAKLHGSRSSGIYRILRMLTGAIYHLRIRTIHTVIL